MLKKKRGFLILLMVILTILCGILRSRELYSGFEIGTGLVISGAPSVLALRLTAGASAVLCVAFCGLLSRWTADYAARFVQGPGRAPLLVGMILMIAAGPADLILTRMSGDSSPVTRLILIAFSVVAGVLAILSMLSYKREESESLRGIFAAAPSFFGCYLLILSYRYLSPEPCAETYLYSVVGTAALVLAWYQAAAHAYRQASPWLCASTASIAFLFLGTAVIGDCAAYAVHGIHPGHVGMLAYQLAGMIWAFGILCAFAAEPPMPPMFVLPEKSQKTDETSAES